MGTLVSVILPFFNADKTLNRAIESIASQSLENFECILIDNNSTDKSIEIAKKWCNNDSRFKLIHEKQQGVVFASNTGAEKAKGSYIARMDADDFSFPHRLKQQAAFLDKNIDFQVVSGLVEYKEHKENTDGFARYVEWVNSVQTYEQICLKQFVESPIVNPSAMWRKETGKRLGLYRKSDFPEDYEMWLRWIKSGVKIKKLNSFVLQWFDSDHRLTRTDSVYSDEAFFKIKSKYLAQWLKKNNPLYPKVAVWGASKISRKRAQFLINEGVEVDFYIDTKNSRRLNKKVIHYKELPLPKSNFILVYMKHIHIRNKIENFLQSKGYKEGKNYLLVS